MQKLKMQQLEKNNFLINMESMSKLIHKYNLLIIQKNKLF